MRRMIGVAATIAAVITAAAGAATPLTHAQYTALLKRGSAQVGKAERALQLGLLRKAPPAEIKRLLLGWAAAEKQFGESLQSIRPPADAASAHGLLARGEIKYAGELQQMADKLPAKASAVRTYLQRSLASATGSAVIIRALTKLRLAGYY